ncbi:hypothetical protein CJF42_14345 [Pseudoalteromonas sp. NBT06-2]|uniref:MerR family transcriptional regulator n=1 Tax=Pseudoalteromonas sp. NBT06-2 TaxID=2025950 RepID=UPI000BA4EFDC|nr:MerR family transcriptional regulator [Pseudoalteromonas sp. NBT06-2]PAJ73742.1 hypothetical protein CJF42_14345 [Pseudoalteromonas sp. NBT06-2]
MYIGKISKETGASIKAIRFYEEIGLLNDVMRSGKYRVYNENHVTLIRLILKAKSLGFRLSEIKVFAEQKNSRAPWACILSMIITKTTQIDTELSNLKKQKEELLNYKKNIVDCLEHNPTCSLNKIELDSPRTERL